MGLKESVLAFTDAMGEMLRPGRLDYLGVTVNTDGSFSQKAYIVQPSQGEPLPEAVQQVLATGAVGTVLKIFTDGSDERFDFHIDNQKNTDRRMRTLLALLKRMFVFDEEALREITALAQLPVREAHHGLQALSCVGIVLKDGRPDVCKLHFRTRFSKRYREEYRNSEYLDAIAAIAPASFGDLRHRFSGALQAGDLHLVGVDCFEGRIVKRKLYAKVRETEKLLSAIAALMPGNPAALAGLRELEESLRQKDFLYVDGFALCESANGGMSVNYYIAIKEHD